MSKQNQIKDFPQNSRKVKRMVIMNKVISIGPLQDFNTVKTRI